MDSSNKELYVFAVIALVVFVGVLFFSRKKDVYTLSHTNITGSYNTDNNIEIGKTTAADAAIGVTDSIMGGLKGFLSNIHIGGEE
ncbi:MAG: hypothetical protein IJY67_03725 [Paludibacteraceae bacterium]|nr:hypothetical protein [Paludibacteraceae bacterium]